MDSLSAEKIKLLYLLLESSDSESDDDDLVALLLQEIKRHKRNRHVLHTHLYSEEEFIRQFRLPRETCAFLIKDFEKSGFYPENKGHGGTPKISAENHILSFLWYAGNNTCLKDIAGRFGIGESTLFRQMERVMCYLLAIAPRYISFPQTEEEKANLSSAFEKFAKFPGVLGCIEGCRIPIRTPNRKVKSAYSRRHNETSVILQGICDSKKAFLDVFTEPPSKIHGSRDLQLSFTHEDISTICSGDYHLLGSVSYPLREWLITPYKDSRELTPKQLLFNDKLNTTKSVIESAFESLKHRFKRLKHLDFRTVDRATQFIISCCVLHNICIYRGNELDLHVDIHESLVINDGQEMLVNIPLNEREDVLKRLGETKRDRLCDN